MTNCYLHQESIRESLLMQSLLVTNDLNYITKQFIMLKERFFKLCANVSQFSFGFSFVFLGIFFFASNFPYYLHLQLYPVQFQQYFVYPVPFFSLLVATSYADTPTIKNIKIISFDDLKNQLSNLRRAYGEALNFPCIWLFSQPHMAS